MRSWCLAGCLAVGHGLAAAQEAPTGDAPRPGDAAPAPATPRTWDAVLGVVASYAPEYAGASRWRLGLRPGGWLRWGRVSIASRSAFVSRSGEPVSGGGVRFDLSPNERLRIGLGLRHDGGRDESDSNDLRGLGDVRPTLRARLGASYPLEDGWRLGASTSVDALGRGGGSLGDISISRGVSFGARTNASFGVAVAFGNRRYLRAYYGVSPEQSARSGYPVYEPDEGLRDVSISAGVRHEVSARWFVFGGFGAARLVGPAAASPIVRERTSWSVSSGLAYRF